MFKGTISVCLVFSGMIVLIVGIESTYSDANTITFNASNSYTQREAKNISLTTPPVAIINANLYKPELCNDTVCITTAKTILHSLNKSVDPCNNFYEFACQGWSQLNPRPNTQKWTIYDKHLLQTKELFTDTLKEPVGTSDQPDLALAKQYFQECKDTYDYSNAAKQNQDMLFMWNKLEEYGGWPILHKEGTWNSSRFDASRSLICLGIEFDNTEFQSAYNSTILANFLWKISNDFSSFSGNFDINESLLQHKTEEIIAASSRLALTKINDLLTERSSCFALSSNSSTSVNQSINLETITCMHNKAFPVDTNAETLANYFHLQMVEQMIPLSNVVKFREYLTKLNENVNATTDEQCAELTKHRFPNVFSYAFVQKNFDTGKTGDVFLLKTMFSNTKQAFLQLLNRTSNTSINSTKQGDKLEAITSCFENLEGIHLDNRYNGLSYNISASFLEQTIALNERIARNKILISLLGTFDICTYKDPEGSVAQYFNKQIYISLGLLQPPFYHRHLPGFWNYGTLGITIGHEIAHGLVDSEWSEFDNGTKTSLADCFIDHYNSFGVGTEAKDRVNGTATLMENLADNAGLLAAYQAYKMDSLSNEEQKLEGLEQYTADQLFFLGFAQSDCGSFSMEALYQQLENDVHAPDQFRVLGTLQNSHEFAKAWNCPVGSPMNPAKEKCKVF